MQIINYIKIISNLFTSTNVNGTNVNISVPNSISKIKTRTKIGVIIDVWKTSERQFIYNMIENTELRRVFSLFFEKNINFLKMNMIKSQLKLYQIF